MKKIIMLVGLATLLASPAFAQAPAGVYGTGNIIFPGNPSAAAAAGAYTARASSQVPPAPLRMSHLALKNEAGPLRSARNGSNRMILVAARI